MKTVIIIGTSHKYQRQETPKADLFRAFVENICSASKVRGITEELSVEALAQHGSSQSVGYQIAKATSVAHRYCDMNNAQRKIAGMIDKIELEYVLDD